MLLHQDIGLEKFNEEPRYKAVHALYECCNSVTWATHVADSRAFADHNVLFTCADDELFALSESAIDVIVQGHLVVGRRPTTSASQLEQCAVWDSDPLTMDKLYEAIFCYEARFGYRFIVCPCGMSVQDLISTIDSRLNHDQDTERKVLRNEIAKINRIRLGRMLGPKDGYYNW
ncbi:MAG: 2-oxo-4-hydroxy-4-carboxy-5-ureidoimidazoline decarboxylase [Mycobacteriaceae bacterium]